jgi:hypothetical protein
MALINLTCSPRFQNAILGSPVMDLFLLHAPGWREDDGTLREDLMVKGIWSVSRPQRG